MEGCHEVKSAGELDMELDPLKQWHSVGLISRLSHEVICTNFEILWSPVTHMNNWPGKTQFHTQTHAHPLHTRTSRDLPGAVIANWPAVEPGLSLALALTGPGSKGSRQE